MQLTSPALVIEPHHAAIFPDPLGAALLSFFERRHYAGLEFLAQIPEPTEADKRRAIEQDYEPLEIEVALFRWGTWGEIQALMRAMSQAGLLEVLPRLDTCKSVRVVFKPEGLQTAAPPAPTKTKRPRFVPPTQEELAEEFHRQAERDHFKHGGPVMARNIADELAETFIAHYTTVGWVVGKARTPMKNWRSAVTTWLKSRRDSGGYFPRRPPAQAEKPAPLWSVIKDKEREIVKITQDWVGVTNDPEGLAKARARRDQLRAEVRSLKQQQNGA